jgi:glycosyltransferase involved in cell wall biosynthesis
VKVAFPYTGYWPYVRRGVERATHDLATYLARRGHDVHVITSTPGRPRVAWDGDVKVTYMSQLNHPLMYRYTPMLRVDAFSFMATRILLREKPDVAHLWAYSGIRYAPFLRRFAGLKYLYHVSVYWQMGFGKWWFPELRGANRVMALNSDAAEKVTAEFEKPCGVLPPPVDTAVFRPTVQRDPSRPRVFFPVDLADRRKGGALLLRAWNRIHRECPSATLVLGGSLGVAGWLQDQKGTSALSQLGLVTDPAARAAIDLRGPGTLDSLPDWYSQASVTVLPSIDEAFGMVLTESLACGTPVVASAHCGPGEIVGDPEIGATVDLRDDSDLVSSKRADELADAILRTIELAQRPGNRSRCRDWASRWSIENVGRRYERLLEEIASAQPSEPEQADSNDERVLELGVVAESMR